VPWRCFARLWTGPDAALCPTVEWVVVELLATACAREVELPPVATVVELLVAIGRDMMDRLGSAPAMAAPSPSL